MEEKFYCFDFAEYNGKIEMNIFLDSLNNDERAKVKAYMEKLVERLNIEPNPSQKLSKYLRDGIFELRIPLKNKISRCLYFFVKGKLIIFTHGFIKTTDKTPNSEIDKAIKIRVYFKGNENE